jgi:hypothetical protein
MLLTQIINKTFPLISSSAIETVVAFEIVAESGEKVFQFSIIEPSLNNIKAAFRH